MSAPGCSWSVPPCAASPATWQTLILFRALQGFGAGGVQPIATTILGDIYSPTERAHVQGLVSSVFGIAAVLGPSLGAFLVEQVSWQLVFWVNLPIGVAAIVMIATFLDESVDSIARTASTISARCC